MPNRAEMYLFFVFAGLLSWIVPLALYLLSKMSKSKDYLPEAVVLPRVGNQVHPRYISAVHAFLFFLSFLLILIPCSTALFDEAQNFNFNSWFVLLVLGSLNLVGLLYVIKKKDISRITSSRFFEVKPKNE